MTDDADNYQDPAYVRSMEITKAQYDRLVEFGVAPAKHGFDMQYGGLRNSCIDFTWAALNHAGLHRQIQGKEGREGKEDKNFQGGVKVLDSIDEIRSIKAPIPESGLNGEVEKTIPRRDWKQRLLTEETQSAPENSPQISRHESIRHPLH